VQVPAFLLTLIGEFIYLFKIEIVHDVHQPTWKATVKQQRMKINNTRKA